jgi:phosphate starvation-inducible PhoH-like protein
MSSKTKRDQDSSLGRFEYLTAAQKYYGETIDDSSITVSTGCPGTGKTYVACYKAIQAFKRGDVSRIVLTKPLVEVGNKTMGFQPGDSQEKMAPFVKSVEDAMSAIIGHESYKNLVHQKSVEILPLNFIRGLTIDGAFLIADEMQNATYLEIKTLLTRIGKNTKYVIDGDLGQTDIENGGLTAFMNILKSVQSVGFVEFGPEDIVRSGIARDITVAIHAYEERLHDAANYNPTEGLMRMIG